jgi:ribosomal protein S18 acetylase RimI-like enzyme
MTPEELALFEQRVFGYRHDKPDPKIVKKISEQQVLTALAEDGRLKGYLRSRKRKGIPHIDSLVVDPEFQRTGVGSQLIQELLAKGSPVSLGVFKKNKDAIRLYERLGFEKQQSPDWPDSYLMTYL